MRPMKHTRVTRHNKSNTPIESDQKVANLPVPKYPMLMSQYGAKPHGKHS